MISIALEAKSVADLIEQLRGVTEELTNTASADPDNNEEPVKPQEPQTQNPEETKPEPGIKPEDVRRALNKLRSMLNEKAPGSGTAKIKELFTHLGVTSFSEIDAEDYDRLMDMTAIAIKEAQDAAS